MKRTREINQRRTGATEGRVGVGGGKSAADTAKGSRQEMRRKMVIGPDKQTAKFFRNDVMQDFNNSLQNVPSFRNARKPEEISYNTKVSDHNHS